RSSSRPCGGAGSAWRARKSPPKSRRPPDARRPRAGCAGAQNFGDLPPYLSGAAPKSTPMRALVIQHDDDAPGGLVSAWLTDRGADEDVYPISVDGRSVDPRAYEMVVSLGSEKYAYDDAVPWVAREVALLRDAVCADVPVLGICFGSQILARALGGQALRARQSEIGWVRIRSDDPGLIADGPWFQWHHDTFTPPPRARLLAGSP